MVEVTRCDCCRRKTSERVVCDHCGAEVSNGGRYTATVATFIEDAYGADEENEYCSVRCFLQHLADAGIESWDDRKLTVTISTGLRSVLDVFRA